MRSEGEDDSELRTAFSGPQVRTLFGTFGRSPAGAGGDRNHERVKALGRIENIISRKFDIIDSRFDEAGIYVRVREEEKDPDPKFEYVRIKLKEIGFFPRLVRQGKDLYIVSYPLPKRKMRGNTVNLVMLVLTIFTTVWAGSILWISRSTEIMTMSNLISALASPMDLLMGGLTFAFPLLLILGTHELGHYFTARRYRIDSSLPYFIPIPPFISPIGTFGALISMKEPMSNRRSLIDIGAAGPIAGFLVAIPVTIIGLVLTDQYPVISELVEGNSYIMINPPVLFIALQNMLGVGSDGVLYPTAFAGWLGLFVTALNLLPVGQLDGGHIARGALGDKAKYVSTATLVLLVLLGLTTGFITYLIFAVLILFLGARHPPPLNDLSPLKKRQYLIAGLSVVIMVLTFHPVPLESVQIEDKGLDILAERDQFFVSPDIPNMEMFELVNDGGDLDTVSVHVRIGGEEVLMSATNISLDVDNRSYSQVLERNPSLFSNGDHYIMLLGPRQFGMKGNSRMGLQFAFGCSGEVDHENSTDVEIVLRTGDGKDSASASFKLIRARQFIESEVETGRDSAVMDLRIWMLDNSTGNSTVSVKFLQGPPAFTVKMGPYQGNWTETYGNFSADLSSRYRIGNISWPERDQVVGNASVRIVVGTMEGNIEETELQVTIIGPDGMMRDTELFLGKHTS